jgi:hypothetical protein
VWVVSAVGWIALGDVWVVVCDVICACVRWLSAWRAVFGHAARGPSAVLGLVVASGRF